MLSGSAGYLLPRFLWTARLRRPLLIGFANQERVGEDRKLRIGPSGAVLQGRSRIRLQPRYASEDTLLRSAFFLDFPSDCGSATLR